nr:hypothetical protein CFP56_78804 [Quercus suber]
MDSSLRLLEDRGDPPSTSGSIPRNHKASLHKLKGNMSCSISSTVPVPSTCFTWMSGTQVPYVQYCIHKIQPRDTRDYFRVARHVRDAQSPETVGAIAKLFSNSCTYYYSDAPWPARIRLRLPLCGVGSTSLVRRQRKAGPCRFITIEPWPCPSVWLCLDQTFLAVTRRPPGAVLAWKTWMMSTVFHIYTVPGHGTLRSMAGSEEWCHDINVMIEMKGRDGSTVAVICLAAR